MALHLFEGAEGIGIRREDLVVPLGLDVARLVDPRHGIEWETFVAILERLSVELGGDVERLRAVGRSMPRAPSYAFLQRIARTVFSLRSLYEAGERWLAPANVPHLELDTTFPAPDRMHFRCRIPEPYGASAPYLHVFEGLLCEIPTILGLPAATIATSTVTPRELDLLLDLPPSTGLLGRIRTGSRALFRRSEALELLEQQRREIATAMEAVRRTSTEIQSLFDRLPDLVVIHRRGVILWTNRAAVTTLGYERADDLVGLRILDFAAPGSQEAAKAHMFGQLDEREVETVSAQLRGRDGTSVLVEVTPGRVVTFGGQEARLVVIRDVTERTRLYEQLLTSDRLASIGMLAAGVAHEVNNPLGYVLNNVEMVIRDLAPLGERTEQSRAALAVALEGVDRIRTIVRDLLALSRIDDVGIGSVDVRAVVESTLALAAKEVEDRGELVCEYLPVPAVRGTPARVGQILLNLLANALEAMPPSRRSTNQLSVVVRPSSGGGALLEVSDNGRGVALEHAGRIFDPFFTTKPSGSGTGLGLAISQRIVAEIGGELSFESTPGVGSTFRVRLASAEDQDGPR